MFDLLNRGIIATTYHKQETAAANPGNMPRVARTTDEGVKGYIVLEGPKPFFSTKYLPMTAGQQKRQENLTTNYKAEYEGDTDDVVEYIVLPFESFQSINDDALVVIQFFTKVTCNVDLSLSSK